MDRVERLAAGLAAEGIGAGDAVALLLPNDPTFVASYYAISALGAIVVPVNPAFKQDELEFYFRQCGIRAVISDDRSAGVCERIVAGWDEPAKVIPTSAAHGQALTLDMLMQSEPAKLDQALARGAARLHVLVGLDRPPQARGPHPRAAARRVRVLRLDGDHGRRTRSSARSRCSTPTAWAAAWSRPRAPARRS